MGRYNLKVDVYSVAVMIMEMLGVAPAAEHSTRQSSMEAQLARAEAAFSHHFAHNVLRRMWHDDASARPSSQDCLEVIANGALLQQDVDSVRADLGQDTAPQEGGALEECYERLLGVPAASEQLQELGVESSADLKDLDREDVESIAACLKKVHGKKLQRTLGFGA